MKGICHSGDEFFKLRGKSAVRKDSERCEARLLFGRQIFVFRCLCGCRSVEDVGDGLFVFDIRVGAWVSHSRVSQGRFGPWPILHSIWPQTFEVVGHGCNLSNRHDAFVHEQSRDRS